MFTAVQKLLPKTINKLGVGRQVTAAVMCEKYRKIAPVLIHSAILSHTFPKYFRNGTLTIACEDSSWTQEITLRKIDLITAINKDLKGTSLERIVTVVERRSEREIES